MKLSKEEIRCLLYSAGLTWLLLFMISGFLIADKNIRKVGFNDDEPLLILENENHEPCYVSFRFMDKIYYLDFTIEYHLKKGIDDRIKSNLSNISKSFGKINLPQNKYVEKFRFIFN